MDMDKRKWDEDILKDIFEPGDAQIISNIPISLTALAGKIIWKWEENGLYSVKSCYNWLLGDLSSMESPAWSCMWKLNVPPKVKNFFWQACVNYLPTRDLLHLKKVDCPLNCTLCATGIETVKHLFVDCAFTKRIWELLGLDITSPSASSFGEWASAIMNKYQSEQICLIIITCWSVWNMRNDKIWTGVEPSVCSAAERGRSFLLSWR